MAHSLIKARYLRLMELVSQGFSWEDAALLVDAPVPLASILAHVSPSEPARSH